MKIDLLKPVTNQESFSINNSTNHLDLNFLNSSDKVIVLTSIESLDKVLNINVKSRIKIKLIEIHDKSKDFQKVKMNIRVEDGAFLDHQIIFLDSKNNSNYSINAKVLENSEYNISYIDLANCSSELKCKIDLISKGASSNFVSAVMANCNDDKRVSIEISNNEEYTKGIINNYGVVVSNGILKFTGTGRILNGAKKSIARQKSTMIVFDKKATAVSEPYLFIDENDVEASHASAVGTIDEEILFYLSSRGLSVNEAKKAVILGHIQPVIAKIEDEKTKNDIKELLERKVFENA